MTAASGVVFCQFAPWQFDYGKQCGLTTLYRRASFPANRLLAEMGVRARTPLLEDIAKPLQGEEGTRWLDGLCMEARTELDDPYRFFIW
jgi:hypothetical protein